MLFLAGHCSKTRGSHQKQEQFSADVEQLRASMHESRR